MGGRGVLAKEHNSLIGSLFCVDSISILLDSCKKDMPRRAGHDACLLKLPNIHTASCMYAAYVIQKSCRSWAVTKLHKATSTDATTGGVI